MKKTEKIKVLLARIAIIKISERIIKIRKKLKFLLPKIIVIIKKSERIKKIRKKEKN